MSYPSPAARTSTRMFRIGVGVTALPVLFLTFDLVIKYLQIPPVVSSFAVLGLPAHLPVIIATTELICLLLYTVPRTAVLGAILLTGYLGGAVALHVRVGDPLLSHVLFPGYIGILAWLGLFLRDARLRALLPLRSPAS